MTGPGEWLQFIAALALMGGAAGGTAWLVEASLRRTGDDEAEDAERLFWVGLTGALAMVLGAVWAVLVLPQLAPLAGAVLLASSGGAVWWTQRRRRALLAQRRRRLQRRRLDSLVERHEAVLEQWRSYELDPFKALERPGLTDVSQPLTSSLIRAMREAEGARSRALQEASDQPSYARAVEALETAWRRLDGDAGPG
ncbi:hypothetical protein BN1051_00392 [Arthrobacter saudimassiliensis]|uniref:Uncharacterized protein n=1 Tax=Arthrobacter saudimassiliensis TaxID=1461584 RepID=A0A078MLA9_9MICC|nr:hypothetical protein BN1051_00392 [Arthrobacter saudimassiliensis]